MEHNPLPLEIIMIYSYVLVIVDRFLFVFILTDNTFVQLLYRLFD